MYRRTVLILFFALVTFSVFAQKERDSTAIYQGLNLKLDLANPILEIARSGAKIQDYEMALNVDLKHRYFPTLELGYAQAKQSAASGDFSGKGGFARVGLDLSALRKSGKDNMLLVGVRVGTAVQGMDMHNVLVSDPYWQLYTSRDFSSRCRVDVWGEVMLGVQVQVYKQFHMGWYARLKILFTRGKDGEVTAFYIPGYGFKQDTNWGLNYYLGWKF